MLGAAAAAVPSALVLRTRNLEGVSAANLQGTCDFLERVDHAAAAKWAMHWHAAAAKGSHEKPENELPPFSLIQSQHYQSCAIYYIAFWKHRWLL